MAEEGGRRKSNRNRGEPPMKLRKTSPAQDVSTIAVTTPVTRRSGEKRGPGRPPSAAKAAKSTPSKAKVKESPKAATPLEEPEEPEESEPVALESIATLMERSRQKWLTEGGVFEKFWTKPPRKKKGQPAVEMPTKLQMNMVEIGQTRIIIEPHVFDIHMWGVKKPALSWQPPIAGPPASTNPYPNQPNGQRPVQNTNPYPKPGTKTAPATPKTQAITPNPYAVKPDGKLSSDSKPTTPAPSTQQAVGGQTAAAKAEPSPMLQTPRAPTSSVSPQPRATPTTAAAPASATQSNQATPSVQATPGSASVKQSTGSVVASPAQSTQEAIPSAPAADPGSTQSPAAVKPPPIQAPAPRAQTARPPSQARLPPTQQQQQQQQSAPHPDPVIQMLAQRAAMDPALKELMKIVAAGSTSPEKLKEFQKHIDDINDIIRRQKQAPGQRLNQQSQRPSPAAGHASKQKADQQGYKSPAFIASKPTVPAISRHDFGNITFDFVRSGDCYLLPRQAIVEHMSDRMTTLISFIVTRKGKDIPDAHLKPDVEYYQPMTMTLLTMEQKIRDIIDAVVLPKDQVKKEMMEVMQRCSLAPSRGTMLGVPDGMDRCAEDEEAPQEDEVCTPAAKDDADRVKSEWEAPNFLCPL